MCALISRKSAATCKAYDWLNWGDEIETIKGIQSYMQKIWDQVVHVLWDSTTGAEIAWKRRRQLRSSWWGPVTSCRHQRQHERGGRSDNLSGVWYPAADNRDAFWTHCPVSVIATVEVLTILLSLTQGAFHIPMGLKHWYPWLGCAHVLNTYSLKTSTTPFT